MLEQSISRRESFTAIPFFFDVLRQLASGEKEEKVNLSPGKGIQITLKKEGEISTLLEVINTSALPSYYLSSPSSPRKAQVIARDKKFMVGLYPERLKRIIEPLALFPEGRIRIELFPSLKEKINSLALSLEVANGSWRAYFGIDPNTAEPFVASFYLNWLTLSALAFFQKRQRNQAREPSPDSYLSAKFSPVTTEPPESSPTASGEASLLYPQISPCLSWAFAATCFLAVKPNGLGYLNYQTIKQLFDKSTAFDPDFSPEIINQANFVQTELRLRSLTGLPLIINPTNRLLA